MGMFVLPFPAPVGGVVGLQPADFMDLLGRLLPSDYLQPLLNPGPGGEVYQMQAAVGSRVSQAIGLFQLASYITLAPDGAAAQATVQFQRQNANAGLVVVNAGTIVQSAQYGRQFQLVAGVTMAAGQVSAFGTVQALFPGEQWNVKGPFQSARGELVAGEISQIVTWQQTPAFGDASITVAQATDAVGGVSSMLNQHGADRGFQRGANEGAAAFRQRVRQLPDTVSPSAIQNAVNAVALQYPGTSWDFIETFQGSFQTAYDCPSPNAGVPFGGATIPSGLDTNLFVYDDPRPIYPPFRNRWLDERDYRGAFIVTVPVLAALRDVGIAYDDTAETPFTLTTLNGSRAANAYDVPQTFTAALAGAYDGSDYARSAAYAGLYASLQKIRAAGVLVVMEIQGF